jgi:hypothetical protein
LEAVMLRVGAADVRAGQSGWYCAGAWDTMEGGARATTVVCAIAQSGHEVSSGTASRAAMTGPWSARAAAQTGRLDGPV